MRRTTRVVICLWLLAAGAAPGAAGDRRKPEQLTNFLLSPRYSQWLLGPISRIASEAEIRAYLALGDDEAAARFIEDFWSKRRNEESPWPTDQPRAIFQRRAQEADRLYSEGARPGRNTDRGAIHILYGPPEETEYRIPQRRGRPPVEVWSYPQDAPPGLDGKTPRRSYYFARQGDFTVEVPGIPRSNLREPGRRR